MWGQFRAQFRAIGSPQHVSSHGGVFVHILSGRKNTYSDFHFRQVQSVVLHDNFRKRHSRHVDFEIDDANTWLTREKCNRGYHGNRHTAACRICITHTHMHKLRWCCPESRHSFNGLSFRNWIDALATVKPMAGEDTDASYKVVSSIIPGNPCLRVARCLIFSVVFFCVFKIGQSQASILAPETDIQVCCVTLL